MPKPLSNVGEEEEIYDGPSKTQRKRDVAVLLELGKHLSELDVATLQRFQLPHPLLDAVLQAKSIHAHAARKRHFKMLAKMLQSVDLTQVQQLLEQRDMQGNQQTERFHQLEILRENLITGGKAAMTVFLQEHPEADKQKVNQWVRNALKERQLEKPPKSARLLFKYLKTL